MRTTGLVLPSSYISVGDEYQSCPHVKALHERYCNGKNWEDTGYRELYNDWYRVIKGGRNSDKSWEYFREKKLYKPAFPK